MAKLVDELKKEENIARMFLYGKAKTKKTWWAGRAAETGLNVVFLNGEPQGIQILKELSTEARSRIDVIDIRDKINFPVMCMFMTRFLKQQRFVWDDDVRTVYMPNMQPQEMTHGHYVIEPSKLCSTDVLVMDSWTALAMSIVLKTTGELDIDLSDPESLDDKRGFYGYAGTMIDWMMDRFLKLNCHTIIIGHETVYEKRDKEGKKVIEQVVQPISTSGPNAKKLAKNFSDMFYFRRVNELTFQIDTGGTDLREGGSRLFPPKTYDWEKLQFKDVLDQIGFDYKNRNIPPCEGVKYIPAGEKILSLADEMKKQQENSSAVGNTTINGGSAPAAAAKIAVDKPSAPTLAALMQQQKEKTEGK